jgi:eukaryotic-like serine/threonine-protein kinase
MSPPVRVREWTLHEEIGRGGMGVVYRATHEYGRQQYAIKLIRPELLRDEEARARFRREAEVLERLRHPGIVEIRLPFKEGDQLYLPMEFLLGRSLAEVLDAAGSSLPFSTARAVAIVREAAEAVGHAHAQDPPVLHRDLKPGNLFLLEEGGAVKVLDFGLARTLGDHSLTGSGLAVGTPAYLAPEVLEGTRATPASDVYALGLVLYRLLAGRLPFDLPDEDSPIWSLVAAVIRGYERGMPAVRAFNAEIGEGLSGLLSEVLDKDPAGRPLDGTALASRLEEVAVEPTVERPVEGGRSADATPMRIEIGKRPSEAQASSVQASDGQSEHGDQGEVPPIGTHMGIQLKESGADAEAALVVARGDGPQGGGADVGAAPVAARGTRTEARRVATQATLEPKHTAQTARMIPSPLEGEGRGGWAPGSSDLAVPEGDTPKGDKASVRARWPFVVLAVLVLIGSVATWWFEYQRVAQARGIAARHTDEIGMASGLQQSDQLACERARSTDSEAAWSTYAERYPSGHCQDEIEGWPDCLRALQQQREFLVLVPGHPSRRSLPRGGQLEPSLEGLGAHPWERGVLHHGFAGREGQR